MAGTYLMVFANRQPERWIDAEIICIVAIFIARCSLVNPLISYSYVGFSQFLANNPGLKEMIL